MSQYKSRTTKNTDLQELVDKVLRDSNKVYSHNLHQSQSPGHGHHHNHLTTCMADYKDFILFLHPRTF